MNHLTHPELHEENCGLWALSPAKILAKLKEAEQLEAALQFALRFALSFVKINDTDVWYVYGGQPGPLHKMPEELRPALEAARLAIRSSTAQGGK